MIVHGHFGDPILNFVLLLLDGKASFITSWMRFQILGPKNVMSPRNVYSPLTLLAWDNLKSVCQRMFGTLKVPSGNTSCTIIGEILFTLVHFHS